MHSEETEDDCARPTTRGHPPTFTLCLFAPACIATRHTPCSEMAKAARSVADRSWREVFLRPSKTIARVILSLFLALATPVFAQLKWEKLEQTFAPSPLDKSVVAKFRFTNVGTSPVTIDDVRTSCGCTTAALDKWEYAPGESGEIAANFQFAGHIGHQEKWIFVTTNAAPREPTLLRLIVNIPTAVTVEPEFVMWRVGDQLEPRIIRIVVADNFPAKIVSVQADNPAVKVEFREVRPGKEIEVTIRPANTDKPENAVLSIRTDYPPEKPEIHYAYALVK